MKRIEKNQIPKDVYRNVFSVSFPQSKELFYKSEEEIEEFFDKVEEIKKTINIPSGIVQIEPIDNRGLLKVTFLDEKISEKAIDQFVEKLCGGDPHS
ncbi:MAG: hypothetical protein BWY43_00287 [candidate division WS2 bacterium ADurb.Bin280]|uniref:Uncharacterized protein n=1 Tax=candidate division WS2 bacterium ADurb.Bin280 TaxID=1852829 RepID=A0A1V5SEG3_9BACT|nr:MAG: hypothetical protein BWY43_00287 [candidate division WS2 bacterium ADurb.Bin280]